MCQGCNRDRLTCNYVLFVGGHSWHSWSFHKPSRIFALVREPCRGLVSIVAAWTCVARSTSLALSETCVCHALRAYHGCRELLNISRSTTCCLAFDTLGSTNPIDSYSTWWYLQSDLKASKQFPTKKTIPMNIWKNGKAKVSIMIGWMDGQ